MYKNTLTTLIVLTLGLAAFHLVNAATQTPGSANQATATTAKTTDSDEPDNEQPADDADDFSLESGTLAKQGATAVEVISAEAIQEHAQLRVFGKISALQRTTLSATSDAIVAEILAQEGDFIEAGEIIAKLVSTSAVEQLQQNQAALIELDARIHNESLRHQNDLASFKIEQEILRISKNGLERFSSLRDQQLSSNTDYETSLRGYQSQQLAMQQRQLSIAQYSEIQKQLQAQRKILLSQIRQSEQHVAELAVTAPFDAVLSRLSVTLGQQLKANDVIAETYSPASLALHVRAPMAYRFDQYPIDQITALDKQGQRWMLESIRPINEFGAQRLTLTNTQSTSLPGSHIELTLTYPINQESVFVPTTALYDQKRVYVVENGKISPVEVTVLGSSEGGYLVNADSFGPAPIISTRLKNPMTGMSVTAVSSTANGGLGQ